MRMIRYSVVNKKTLKRVFTSCSYMECQQRLEELSDNNLGIAYKWLSI